MKYFGYLFFLVVICVSLFTNCAKRGTITGGPMDSIPPVLLKATPENFSTHFNEKIIKLTFDEYIKLDKINQQLIISPPMDYMPEITPMGLPNKTITVKILDTLKDNTTYSINFGESIVDNNEGNKYPSLRYVFSTGDYIDSLTVTARIKDAISKKNNSYTKIMLYDAETFTDSTVFQSKPLYVANSLDSLITVSVENVKEGKYHLFALHESNNNYKFDPATDKIAFLDHIITTPNDTVYDLVLFQEDKKLNFGRPSMLSANKWLIAAEGDLSDTKIEVSDFQTTLRSAFYKVSNKDSLHVFIPPTNADSLLFKITSKDFVSEQVVRTRTQKLSDSLDIRLSHNGSIDFMSHLKVSATTPMTKVDTSLIYINKKDQNIPFSITMDTLANEFTILFDKEENSEYTATILPKAIEDVFGSVNDTLRAQLKTGPLTDYANLAIQINHNTESPLILQLLNDKEDILFTQNVSQDDKVYFQSIKPALYFIRIIVDENANGKWDTGNYLLKRQPERIINIPSPIDVRANWEMNENITIP